MNKYIPTKLEIYSMALFWRGEVIGNDSCLFCGEPSTYSHEGCRKKFDNYLATDLYYQKLSKVFAKAIKIKNNKGSKLWEDLGCYLNDVFIKIFGKYRIRDKSDIKEDHLSLNFPSIFDVYCEVALEDIIIKDGFPSAIKR